VRTLTDLDDHSPARPSTLPSVDVVILTWNDGEMLKAAVASALRSEGVDVNVIVVDNGSEPPAVVPDDPRVRLIRNDANLGVAPARNQGVRAGSAPIVCLLDSDARLHPGTLRALHSRLDDDAALISPVFDGQAPEASGGRAPGVLRKASRALGLTEFYGSTRPSDRIPTWDVDFTIGACQLIRRRAFEQVGGLDSSIFYGPEDVDFCLRLKTAGWRVYQTSATSCHHPPRRRNRRLLTRRGMAHAIAVLKHLRRHGRMTRDARKTSRLG